MRTEMTKHEKEVFQCVDGDTTLYKCVLALEKSKNPSKLIYEWIKTGHINYKQYEKIMAVRKAVREHFNTVNLTSADQEAWNFISGW